MLLKDLQPKPPRKTYLQVDTKVPFTSVHEGLDQAATFP